MPLIYLIFEGIMMRLHTAISQLKPLHRHALMDLMWLGFLFIPMLGGQYGWAKGNLLWPTFLAIGLYLPIHFYSFGKRGPILWVSQALTFGLGAWLMPYNTFAHTLWLYAGLPADRASQREAIVTMIVCAVAAFFVGQYYGLPGGYQGIYDGLLFGIGMAEIGRRAARESKAALSAKDEEIARLAKTAERERIARDVHDLLGHTLSLIALKAELAAKLAEREPVRAGTEMSEVATSAREALAQVRQAIVGLRSVGLVEALRNADAMLTAAGLDTQLDMQPLPRLTPAGEYALAHALIEASTNIVRHADAARVTVSLIPSDSELVLRVQDDGRGCAPLPGNGLTGMRERLEAVGGRLDIVPASPGLRLQASVPLASAMA